MALQRDAGINSAAFSTNPKNLVRSLEKGFRVLEPFGAAEPELTLAEAARRAKLDNATAFRLRNTLVALGYVDLGVDVHIGSRIPAHCSALGLAILAYLPRGDQSRILASRRGRDSRRGR